MMKLLIVLVLILGIMAIVQLVRVYELTSRLRGKREEDISSGDNRMNARLMWLFPFFYFAFFLWLVIFYRNKMLPVSGSEHGVEYDRLMDFNWYILISVFVITNALLFYFSGKYVFNRERRAYWQPHNNKLELAWTVAPAAVLAVIIIYGLTSWNKIMAPADPDAVQVEVYGKQFDWTVRYPGRDGVLGATDYRLINATNPLGIVTPESIETRLQELREAVQENETTMTSAILPDHRRAQLIQEVESMRRMQQRILNLRTLMQQDIAEHGNASTYLSGADDIVTKDFVLPVDQEALLLIRSRDIIHSVYIPHMRVQMNAVPGMTTTFKFTPTITTDSMRTHIMRDDAFDYVMLCNKICGVSHYNMQMPLMVVTPGEYNSWYAEQMGRTFQPPPGQEGTGEGGNMELPQQQGQDQGQVEAGGQDDRTAVVN
jgi:cytochrome c oxidase subunit II